MTTTPDEELITVYSNGEVFVVRKEDFPIYVPLFEEEPTEVG